MGHRRQFRRAAIGAGAGTVAFLVWMWLRLGGTDVTTGVDDLGELVAAAVAGVACLAVSRRHTGRSRRTWVLLGLSAFSWAAGEAVWSWYELVRGVDVPFPSLADVGYLGAVPLAVAAVLAFPTAPARATSRARAMLDACLIAASLLFVSWALVLGPVYRGGSGAVLDQVLSLAYPAGDVVIVAIIVIAAARVPRGGRAPLVLVGAGLVAMAVADSAFAYLTQIGSYASGNLVDTGWFAGYALLALGALRSTDRPGPEMTRAVRARVLLPYVPAVLAFGTAVGMEITGTPFGPFLRYNGLALIALLTVRQLLALLENTALNKDLEAKVESRTAELARREARFAALVQHSSDVVSLVGLDGVVRYQSPSVERMFGWRPEEVSGRHVTTLLHPGDAHVWQAAVARVTNHVDADVTVEWRLRHRDGSWRHVEAIVTNLLDETAVGHLVVNSRDVTERKLLEEQLRHQAFHDSLTGLANRALFRNRLEHALARQDRERRPLAVLFVDLDDFKSVNDGRGHGVGDDLLAAVGARFQTAVRSADTVARMGGDEFAVLLESMQKPEEAFVAAERVLHSFEEPFDVDGAELFIGASIGVAIGDGSVDDADELIRNADVAMYVAKGAGKGRYEVFRSSMQETVLERLQLEIDLRRAIEHGELAVHYQPIVDLASQQIVGVEALVRWHHPERGLVPPSVFIPIAEATGLIVPIGEWVLGRACRDVRSWEDNFAAATPLSLSVNVSALQLDEPGLVDVITSTLVASGLAPDRLTLEITESALMRDVDGSVEALLAIKRLGVRVAIDDFGTGYSSLSYLRRLPIDVLKIDQSFVSVIARGPEEAGLVRTIVNLARELRLDTVGEGIEEVDQLEELTAMGCRLAQGYYFARPVPAAQLEAMLTGSATIAPAESVVTPAPLR